MRDSKKYGVPAGLAVLGAVIGLHRAGLPLLWSYLLAVNAVTFLFYGLDKLLAARDLWRVPEVVLQAMALFGGSPAAFAGQKIFRHKTLKKSFRRTYLAVVILQAVVIVALVYYLYGR